MTSSAPRQVHEAVGSFLIIMLLVLMVFGVRSAFVHHWFASSKRLTVIMPPQGSYGLVEGCEVIVLGTRAGYVDRINFNENNRMQAVANIRDDFARFIHAGSRVYIRKTLGIAGETYLSIVNEGGEGPPPDPRRGFNWDEDVLRAQPDRSSTERLGVVLETLGDTLLPAIREFQSGIERWSEVAEYLRDPRRDFGPVLAEIRQLTERLNQGEGALGRLLTDEQMGQDIKTLVDRAQDISRDTAELASRLRAQSEDIPGLVGRLQSTLTDMQVVVAKMRESGPQTIDGIHDAAARLPDLVLQAQEAIRDIELLAEALRERFAPNAPTAAPSGQRVSPEEAVP